MRKISRVFVLAILVSMLAPAMVFGAETPRVITSSTYDEVWNFKDGVAWVKRGGYWGLIDKDGNEIKAPQYRKVSPFNEGLAFADGRFIDNTGNTVFTLPSGRIYRVMEYDFIHEEYVVTGVFVQGLAIVRFGDIVSADQYEIIDRTGRNVSDNTYDYATYYEEGLILVEKDGKLGFVGQEGEIVSPEYDKSNNYNERRNHAAYNYNEGMIRVSKAGKYGFINKTGVVISPQYDAVGLFSEGLAAVNKDGKWGYIDKSGNQVIDFLYESASSSREGILAVKRGGKWGFIDHKGNVVADFKYDSGYLFNEGFAAMKKGDKWGFVNQSNEEVIPLKYDEALPFRDGLAKVSIFDQTANKYKSGYIDYSGNEVIPIQYHTLSEFQNDRVVFCNDVVKNEPRRRVVKECGVMDRTGKTVIDPIYNDINVNGKLFVVRKPGERDLGLVNVDGKVIVENKYNEIKSFSDGLAAVSVCNIKLSFTECNWGYIDETGKEVIEPQFFNVKNFYLGVKDFHEGFAAVNFGGFFQEKWGFIAKPMNVNVVEEEIQGPNNTTAHAVPNSSKVLVNGKEIAFQAYTINQNNYFKLRDIAQVLNGTEKSFAVDWDGELNAINLESGKPYEPQGGELTVSSDPTQETGILSDSTIYLDGKVLDLTAYTINGNNYFKLRDLADALDFGVGWDGASNTITIDSSTGYVAE